MGKIRVELAIPLSKTLEREFELELDNGIKVKDLVELIKNRLPMSSRASSATQSVHSFLIVIGNKVARPETEVDAGSTVKFFLPAAGG